MHAEYLPYSIQLKYPFGVSGNTRTHTPLILVKLSEGSISGYGEASLPPYLAYTQNQVNEVLGTFNFSNYTLPKDLDLFLKEFTAHAHKCPPALAAIDIALNDWLAKHQGTSLWKLKGINPSSMKNNAITIGIDTPEVIEKKVKETGDFNLIKVKLGADDDRLLVETIRQHTDKPIIADVNQGWHNLQTAKEMVKWLHDKHCLLIEQPFKKDDLDSHYELKKVSPIPVIADESFQQIEQLSKIAESFNGINIKLMKCGGITPAEKIISAARRQNLKILMGCMNESSCANLAAATLAPLCDWVDLDGPFLITNNPFEDFSMLNGKIVLPDAPGIGAVLKEQLFKVEAPV